MKNIISIFLFILIVAIYFAVDDILAYYIENFDSFDKNDLNKYIEILDLENTDHNIIYGSILVRKSKYEWFLPLKYYYLYSGIIKMKEVIKGNFDNLLYRYIRGKTLFEIKEFSFSKDIIINDFEYIRIRINNKINIKYKEVLYILYLLYAENNNPKQNELLNELKELR
jgi:hypothetical protein